MTALILGAGIAGAAIAGRVAINVYARASAGAGLKAGAEAGSGLFSAFRSGSKYYKGGFEQKMSKREAGLILGIRYWLPYFRHTEKRIAHLEAIGRMYRNNKLKMHIGGLCWQITLIEVEVHTLPQR